MRGLAAAFVYSHQQNLCWPNAKDGPRDVYDLRARGWVPKVVCFEVIVREIPGRRHLGQHCFPYRFRAQRSWQF